MRNHHANNSSSNLWFDPFLTPFRDALNEENVREKAKSAIKWCEVASGVDKAKKWEYRLVPDDAVKRTSDFAFTIGQAVTVT
jgi:hypothetical protein